MNSALLRRFRAILLLALAVLGSSAMQAETGTITAGTVNVRGRAGFIGEIITRVKEGDAVTILEAVKLPNAKPGEPADWLKIALPANTPVWVHATYVDPATRTVTASRLTVRGGPGVNYSVLGFVEKGTAVNELRRKDDWMEIEPVAGLHGFVAASMVKRGEPAAVPANVPTETAPAVTETPAPPVTETVTETKPAAPVGSDIGTPAPGTPAPSSTTIVADPAPAIVTPPPATDRELTTDERAQQVLEQRTRDSQRWEVATNPDDSLLKELPEHRRVVTREGKVRHSVSIQAPGAYILVHTETGLRLNYLYTSSTNVPLGDLVGIKVRIKGEEGIDERWPGTPVLLIKSLEVLP